MEDKHLKRIAEELAKMNRHFEQLIHQMQDAKKQLAGPDLLPAIGSTGEIEPKQSDK